MKPRNLKMRIAVVAIPAAVAIGVLAFALTPSSSAQTAGKAPTPTTASKAPTPTTAGKAPTPTTASKPPTPIANPSPQMVTVADAVTAATRGSFGNILVSGSGATLYRYDADKPNMPTCTGGCAMAWPPLLLPVGTTAVKAGGGLTGVGSVMLSDGRRQLTYNQMPLYMFASDSGTSVNGQGVGGFSVVHPTSTSSTTAKTSTTPTTMAPTTSPAGGYGY
jgi:predicted lipoprotein with Yx(FWY)xxD motif